MTYPIVIPASPSTLSAWQGDEEASYEDFNGGAGHVYVILGRHRARIEVRTLAEATTVIRSGQYHGDPNGWDDRPAYRRAVALLTARLRSATVKAEHEATFPSL